MRATLTPLLYLLGWLLTVGLVSEGAFGQTGQSPVVSVRAGIGYEFLSQEYFLADTSSDPLADNFALKTNYLDDLKGEVRLSISPFSDRRLEIATSYQQTADLFRLRLQNDFRTKLGSARLKLSGELDWRNQLEDSAEFSSGYVYGYGRAGLSVPLTENLTGRFRVFGESVRFEKAQEYSYNYSRFGIHSGVEKLFADFSFAHFDLFFQAREVPDSARLNYLNFGLDAFLFKMYNSGQLELTTRFERKDFNQSAGQGDNFRFEFDGRNQVMLSGRLGFRQETDLEIAWYSSANPANFDYTRIGWALLLGYTTNTISFYVGPDFEVMAERQELVELEENYFETGLKTDFGLSKLGRFFGSLESIIGYRNLADTGPQEVDPLLGLPSDFLYERLNLLIDVSPARSISLSLLFGGEWEWHKNSAENSRIFLLSSSLQFRL